MGGDLEWSGGRSPKICGGGRSMLTLSYVLPIFCGYRPTYRSGYKETYNYKCPQLHILSITYPFVIAFKKNRSSRIFAENVGQKRSFAHFCSENEKCLDTDFLVIPKFRAKSPPMRTGAQCPSPTSSQIWKPEIQLTFRLDSRISLGRDSLYVTYTKLRLYQDAYI